MRRFILFFALFVAFMAPAHAQRFRVGLLGGVNMTDVDGMDPTDYDNDFHKFGFTGGIYVNNHIATRTILQLEIAYSQKGSSFPPVVDTNTVPNPNPTPNPNQNQINNNFYYTLRLNYVNIDLLVRQNLHVTMGKSPTDRFSLEGGISMGYLFHYSYTAQSIAYTLPLKSNDISAFAGFSYNFSDNFCIDLRYYNSIFSVYKDSPANSQWLYYGSWNRGHNLNFQITFKYTFGSGTPASDNPTPQTPSADQSDN